ncbi:glycosyltransferase family 2 protein [Paenibacillus piscarius]|uniref:glycosyltransferase family 2 protein n=1 Tax=Paenibacillus piscarius TaxID=1089681 RepID=UPI001EE82C33|nr:glycosyltransferase [Paenibacillus piscarius]
MKISILVLAYNIKELVTECLLSLNGQVQVPEESFEVVLVDDGSDDGTRERIAALRLDYSLRYIYRTPDASKCRSAARNLGASQAGGDILLFLDGDQVVERDFIYQHWKVHQLCDEPVVVMGLRDFLAKENPIPFSQVEDSNRSSLILERRDPRLPIIQRFSENAGNIENIWALLYSCNFSVKKTIYWDAGGFDEDFIEWGLEDCELAYRFYRIGTPFILNTKCIVLHQYHPASYDDKKYLGWFTNLELFKQKHPALEVELQSILGDWFDPARRKPWKDAFIRYELAVRSVRGLYNQLNTLYKVAVIHDNSIPAEEWLSRIALALETQNVLVLDYSRTDLDLRIQLVPRSNDLLYYREPSADRVIEVMKSIAVNLSEL